VAENEEIRAEYGFGDTEGYFRERQGTGEFVKGPNLDRSTVSRAARRVGNEPELVRAAASIMEQLRYKV
jgi:hypothetical protein